MKFHALFAAALALVPAAVAAQDVGATVTGNDGNAIGTVVSNDGTTVVVDTGAHQIPVAADVFGTGDAGPTLNITKAELDAMHAQALAEAAAARDAALVEGVAVITADAQPLGSVSQIAGDNIVVREGDFVVTLPRDMLALDGQGNVMALATMDAIQEAVAAMQAGG